MNCVFTGGPDEGMDPRYVEEARTLYRDFNWKLYRSLLSDDVFDIPIGGPWARLGESSLIQCLAIDLTCFMKGDLWMSEGCVHLFDREIEQVVLDTSYLQFRALGYSVDREEAIDIVRLAASYQQTPFLEDPAENLRWLGRARMWLLNPNPYYAFCTELDVACLANLLRYHTGYESERWPRLACQVWPLLTEYPLDEVGDRLVPAPARQA